MSNRADIRDHTPAPWMVLPCPVHAGKHICHDHRWIATADAEVERGAIRADWGLSRGSLICEMRDGPPANAHLIAAAPELLAALESITDQLERVGDSRKDRPFIEAARAAIAKAEGRK